ncbi:hypothetical protein EDB85DRAFT_1453490 [Lactarius pseudohatsudake]|nr:hypothetical protein EDB85DRAFT_1453490 [Lactarius pseudohatsudake]
MTPPGNKSNTSAADCRMKGNLLPEQKQGLEAIMRDVMSRSDLFGASISRRVVITEASIVPKAEEASRTEVRVVCEVTVEEGKSLHGGCAAFLIDSCSTLVFIAAGPQRWSLGVYGCGLPRPRDPRLETANRKHRYGHRCPYHVRSHGDLG